MKDGLFHEFKKYGKVTSVQIHGASEERYGLVFFRQQEDQEKALSVSKGKLFFGMMIEVTAWNGPGKNLSLFHYNVMFEVPPVIWLTSNRLCAQNAVCMQVCFHLRQVCLNMLLLLMELVITQTWLGVTSS